MEKIKNLLDDSIHDYYEIHFNGKCIYDSHHGFHGEPVFTNDYFTNLENYVNTQKQDLEKFLELLGKNENVADHVIYYDIKQVNGYV